MMSCAICLSQGLLESDYKVYSETQWILDNNKFIDREGKHHDHNSEVSRLVYYYCSNRHNWQCEAPYPICWCKDSDESKSISPNTFLKNHMYETISLYVSNNIALEESSLTATSTSNLSITFLCADNWKKADLCWEKTNV